MTKTAKKTHRTRAKRHEKSSRSDHGGSQVTEHRKISIRELWKHPDLMIDPRRFGPLIKAADVRQLLAGQSNGRKQPDHI